MLSSIAFCFNLNGPLNVTLGLIASCLIVSSGILYVGVVAVGVMRFVSNIESSFISTIIPPSCGTFFGQNDVGPEELLLKIDQWNNMMIPALHMIILLLNFILNAIWYFVPIASYTQCLWANFGLTVCVLLIETYLKNDGVNRGSLAILSTVKKSYLRL